MLPFVPPLTTVPHDVSMAYVFEIKAPKLSHAAPLTPPVAKATPKGIIIPNVPFFSQFKDIRFPQWQAVGCGVTSLAMVINFYRPGAVSVNSLLEQGIAAGAYDEDAGWTYEGLIDLSRKYGLAGDYYDLSALNANAAFGQFRDLLQKGPVILAVHNNFNPWSSIPHLVVADGIKNNVVYYNDPAAKTGKKKIGLANFLAGWKQKVIVLRPIKKIQVQKLSLQ